MGGRTAHVRARVVLRRVEDVTAPIGVEVGVFQGAMSVALLTQHQALYLYMVDNWLPPEEQPVPYRAYGDYHSRLSPVRQQRNRMATMQKTASFAARRTILDMSSMEAARQFDSCQCDFVFLDADHSYEGVKADLAAWWPKVRQDGWLCGHDYGPTEAEPLAGYMRVDGELILLGVKHAVDEWAGRLKLTVTIDRDGTWFVKK